MIVDEYVPGIIAESEALCPDFFWGCGFAVTWTAFNSTRSWVTSVLTGAIR